MKVEKIIEAKDRELQHKTFKVAEFKIASEPEGIIEAIVSVFNNEDDGGDIVRQGFFKASLERKLPPGVWMHNWETTVAKAIQGTRELAPGDALLPDKLKLLGGLYIKGQFNLATQRGREAFSDIQFGIVDEFSFGYMATKVMWDEENWTRELIEGEIFEWSPVLVGMNRETMLLSAKGAQPAKDILIDGAPFAEDLAVVIAAAKRIAGRAKARQDLLIKQGRVLSATNIATLQDLSTTLQDSHVSIRAVFEAIDALVDSALGEPEDEEPGEEDAGKAGYDLSIKQLEVELAAALMPA